MATKYLGTYFDIHCGGEDLMMVHHPNEIAQSQACHGTRLANFWMHGYFLRVQDSRMGKSLGNFLRLQTLIDQGYDPLVWRFFCLGAHYRSKANFTWESVAGSATALARLRQTVYEWGSPGLADESFLQRFKAHVNNDLNLPQALALTWELVRSDLTPAAKKATIIRFDDVLGLGLAYWQPAELLIPPEVQTLAEQRQMARSEKRWTDADVLRDELRERGFEIEDTATGFRLRSL